MWAISSSVTLLRSSVISSILADSASVILVSSSGIFPYCSSLILAKSLLRCAASRSAFACSNSSLRCCAPCTTDFSLFQISSKSAYSFSNELINLTNSFKRSLEALSFSFLSAILSILSCTNLRSSLSIDSGFESISIRICDAASSIKSMALSGNCLSVI